jgi:hypothetical protein
LYAMIQQAGQDSVSPVRRGQMITKGKKVFLAVGILGSILGGAAPALAQHSGGGGGGGHSSGGGHFSGGGHAGVSGGHAAGRAGSGAHFAGTAHFASGFHGSAVGFHGGAFAGHAGFSNGRFAGRGFSTGASWRGGFWRGGFWPGAFYGAGFSWFLPILPLAYATYWWGGVPYYYANDAYYTYDPSYEGYVATDPPPVSDSGNSGGSAQAPNGAQPMPQSSDPAQQGGAGQIFMYPKNGQSVQQQSQDKAECQQWATQQAGQVAQNSSDYQRAMVACVEGRGYSAR